MEFSIAIDAILGGKKVFKGCVPQEKGVKDMSDTNSVIAAFSEDHTSTLTGVTVYQLRYWDRTDFYRPTYAEENRRIAFSRIYSFKDIVALRVLNVLRNQYSVSLPHLREVSERLNHLAENRWTGTKLYVLNKRVIWQETGTPPREIVTGQYVVPMLLGSVIADTERDVKQLNAREDAKHGIIEHSRFVSHNAPVIAGTRITVASIKRFFHAGYTIEQILEEYPDITEKDVKAAIDYDESRIAA